MFRCCGQYHKGKFTHRSYKPFYRMVEYGICPHCGTKHFIDFKQIFKDDSVKEKMKIYKDKAAETEYRKWNRRLNNTRQGTLSNQFFYYGDFEQNKKGIKVYRRNFNNEKELLSEQKLNKKCISLTV